MVIGGVLEEEGRISEAQINDTDGTGIAYQRLNVFGSDAKHLGNVHRSHGAGATDIRLAFNQANRISEFTLAMALDGPVPLNQKPPAMPRPRWAPSRGADQCSCSLAAWTVSR